MLQFRIKDLLLLLFRELPNIPLNTEHAEAIAHAHDASPFESISSANDYRDLYSKESVGIIYFKRGAALPGLQNSWMSSPLLVKNMIQKVADFLINKNILCGDYHICVFKNKNPLM